MPPLDAGGHLIDYLFKVGPSTAGEVISFQEIAAWSDLTGYRLNGWEAETLRSLSGAYLSEYHDAADAKRPPPYMHAEAVPAVIDREAVSRGILAAFKALAGQSEDISPPPFTPDGDNPGE